MTKILIVDDSRINLEVAKNVVLSNMQDIVIDTANSGLIAMEMLKNNEYHVILLDIVMPEITGIEILQWIVKNMSETEMKVIMFSSLTSGKELATCFELGAYDFISKPLETSEFLARLKHAILEYDQARQINKNIDEISYKNSQLEKLNSKLKETQMELLQTERLAGIGYLAAGMAHEINNPLGYVHSNFMTLKSHVKDINSLYEMSRKLIKLDENCDEKENMISELEDKLSYDFISEDMEDTFLDIDQGLNRIKDIVSSLRGFSQTDSSERWEPVLLGELFNNIKQLTKAKFEGKVNFVIEVEPDSSIYCNKAGINLSLMNIINNSYESILKRNNLREGSINVKVINGVDETKISITDNGIGMHSDVKKHALDPFFTTKDIGDGAGLGLSTSYNFFVNRMKGKMQVDSTVDVGTNVTITIPKKESENQ